MGKYVNSCDIYQRMKNRTEIPAGKLMMNEIPERTWTYLMVDFITKLPLVVEKDVILVVCNRLSKIIYFMATTEETTAKGLARLFQDNVWKLHRLPESIISNRGPQFVVELTRELNKILSRLLTVDFILFSLLLYFYFYFSFIFYFLFLEQLRLGFISHAVTSVTN